MKSYIILFCIFTVMSVNAQKDTENGRWQVGINLQPALSYRMHTGFKNKTYFSNDQLNFGYDMGINVSYDIFSMINFESGIHYGSFGFGRLHKIYAHSVNLPTQIEETLFWNYVMVPLKANLHTNWRKLDILGGISLTPGYMVSKGGHSVATYHNGKTNTQDYDNVNESDRRFNLFAGANFGVAYHWTQRFTLRGELNYQVATLKIQHSNSSLYNLYPWNAGINVGCYIRMGKV